MVSLMMQKKSEQIIHMLRVIGDGLQDKPIVGLSKDEAVLMLDEGRQYGIDVLLYYLMKKIVVQKLMLHTKEFTLTKT
jgi:hypothetical protein